MAITYDYEGQLKATKDLEGAIEAYLANGQALITTGDDLVANNNAEGIKATMDAYQEKQTAVKEIMNSLLEQANNALATTRELHIANGGEA